MQKRRVKSPVSTRQKKEAIWGLAFVAPTIAGLVILNFIPIVQTIWQSLCKTGDFGRGNIFIGLKNFQMMMFGSGSRELWMSLWNTIKYSLLQVPLSIIIALFFAVLLNKKIKGRSIYRTIFFLPMVCAPAAIAMVWKWIYNQKFGLLNHILGGHTAWISDPKIAWISIAIIGIWSSIGYNMVLFIGGLQEIPHDYYEAATIDGANGWQQFLHITLALISPTTFFVLQTGIIGALTVFDLMFMVIDKTNPAMEKTQSIVYLFYQYSFVQNNKGAGSAIVVILLVFLMIITFILQKLQKKLVYQP
ncbi:MAG: sugar ABC transporter permease [Lachnospiraceae bacterium]|nr:sugar ABC transporter permease [Lachnospiraceae bacterium]MDD6428398.1 sugar ABC transporter permease [Lachnospiraceae bacterium]